MEIQARMRNGVRKVRITGEMTIYNAAESKQELLWKLDGANQIEIDMSGVSELDSAGLQLLILLKHEAGRQGKALRLLAHSLAVLEVFNLVRADTLFGDPVVLPSGT